MNNDILITSFTTWKPHHTSNAADDLLQRLIEKSYLWFRGRRKQLIVHDGHNISPQEVEEVFYHHPAVFAVGVIGIPDAFEGETIHAFIALKPMLPASTPMSC